MKRRGTSSRIEPDEAPAGQCVRTALNETGDPHLEATRWQAEQIKRSLQQADQGKLVPHANVTRMARKWKRP